MCRSSATCSASRDSSAVAAEAGKKVELVVTGAAGELDRQVLEACCRRSSNAAQAVIHGIEAPEERIRRGKPETGRIEVNLSARRRGRRNGQR